MRNGSMMVLVSMGKVLWGNGSQELCWGFWAQNAVIGVTLIRFHSFTFGKKGKGVQVKSSL